MLIFGFVSDARKKLRPMRPKPLIPTLIMKVSLLLVGHMKKPSVWWFEKLPQRWGLR